MHQYCAENDTSTVGKKKEIDALRGKPRSERREKEMMRVKMCNRP